MGKYPDGGLHLSVEKGNTAFGETISDEFGDFAIVVCTMKAKDSGESKPAWRLKATATEGAVLFSSKQPFELAPGAVVYIEITVPERGSDS